MEENYLKELSRKVDDQINELDKIKQEFIFGIHLNSIEWEFNEVEYFLRKKLFVSLEEVSSGIKETEDVEVLRRLHFLYSKIYRATLIYLNEKMEIMSNCYFHESRRKEREYSESIRKIKLDVEMREPLIPYWLWPWLFC